MSLLWMMCSGCLSLGDLVPDIETPTEGAFGFVEVDGERFPVDDIDRAEWTESAGLSLLEVSARAMRTVDGVSFSITVIDLEGPISGGNAYDVLDGANQTGVAVAIARADGLKQSGVLYCAGDADDDTCLADGDRGALTIDSIDDAEAQLSWNLGMVAYDEDADVELGDVRSQAQLTVPILP